MTYDRVKLERELIRDEDERFRVYRCTADKLSVGIGRNLEAKRFCTDGSTAIGITPAETKALGITVKSIIANGITRTQSRALFANDIAGIEKDLDRALPWWRKLDPVRQRVLLNMCFNMGIGRAPVPAKRIKGAGLLQFVNTLPKMQAGDFAGAARGMKASLWHDQVGQRAIRLEAMMATGKEPA